MSTKKGRLMVPPPSLRPTVSGKDHAVSCRHYREPSGDPKFVKAPAAALLPEAHAARQRTQIDMKHDPATGRLHAAGDPRREAYAMAW